MSKETNDSQRIKEGTKYLFEYDENFVATEMVQKELLVCKGDLVNKFIEELNKEEGLYFGEKTTELMASRIVSGLLKGNIILEGPPGTGKTSLIGIIERVFNVDIEKITAIPEWTTYDIIGGLKPDKNKGLVGRTGRVIDNIQ